MKGYIMAEYENLNFNKGHQFDLKQIRLDLFRFSCYFESSEFLSLENNSDGKKNYQKYLQKEFFIDEVSRILLQTAIVLRIFDDDSEADCTEKNPFYCGKLIIENKEKKLSLREACNKIIHTDKVNFDIVEQYYKKIIYLYGRIGQRDWKVSLDVDSFVNHGTRLLSARTFGDYVEYRDSVINSNK